MKKPTTEEKERIRAMLEQQDAEQHKKRRRYRTHKTMLTAMVKGSKQGGDYDRVSEERLERLENLEKKHEETEHQVAKRSELRTIHLTDKEKRELEAKIREAK